MTDSTQIHTVTIVVDEETRERSRELRCDAIIDVTDAPDQTLLECGLYRRVRDFASVTV